MKFLLKDYLEVYGISIQDLAKAVGVTRQTMAKLVNGETASVKFDDLEQICLALDCTPNDLFEFEESDPDKSKVIISKERLNRLQKKFQHLDYQNSGKTMFYELTRSEYLKDIVEDIVNDVLLKRKDDTK